MIQPIKSNKPKQFFTGNTSGFEVDQFSGEEIHCNLDMETLKKNKL
jgi:hypothetical protein